MCTGYYNNPLYNVQFTDLILAPYPFCMFEYTFNTVI